MTDWKDELMKCGAAAAGGAAGAGVATGGVGAVAGGLYACAQASSLDALAWRGIKSMASEAWGALSGLFEDDKQKAPPSLDFALARTARSLEHSGDGVYRYSYKLDGKLTWKEGDPARIWHEANRVALYGDAGRALTPEALYAGLARMFRFTRPTAAQRGAEGALLDAVVAFGDFLQAHGPDGDINTWYPTERLRQLAQSTTGQAGGIKHLDPSPSSTSPTGPILGVVGVLTLLLGGAALLLNHRTTTPERP